VPLKLKLPSVPSKPKAPVPVPTVPTPTVPTPTVPTPTVPKLPAAQPASLIEPSSRSSASSGNGGALFESASQAAVDPHSGDVVSKGESSLGRVSLGGGQIVIHGIHVLVTVRNNGKPTAKIAVDVGAASIGGVPVTIGQDGVRVKGKGQNLPFAKADAALNAALQKAGVKLHTVEPETKKAPNEETVTATGVHVAFFQPVDAPGVPAQFVDHIVGEVFVDSLAAPAGPIPKLNLGGGLGSAVGGPAATGGGSTGLLGGTAGGSPSAGYSSQPGSTGSSAATASAAPSSSLLGSVTSKPTWLLVAYLVWQTLVLGTGITMRRWWTGGAS